ncbi:threonine dehydrogenase [Lentzea sp. NBRC 105346]|uniref:glucose 1-dehydrogenase n=1 Tax=Lentzea sp. NBRC 105346 TaxID=3032205 RepID=UPI0024A141CF|nr:glucose 1-dehydrogenase [Lentzea sp. NBRC 105346]GLZ31667.1 threonine dehydrogenase [Lentzea sp. NBRC 105346]
MRALTVDLGAADSLSLDELPDPEPKEGELLVKGIAVGICGTDREIVRGEFGTGGRLVIGHESLGRVLRAAPGFEVGDYVTGVVRRPDPEPCGPCAQGLFDMCRNGKYTERGITGIDGYASELWILSPEYAIVLDPRLHDVGVLVEPTSVVVKAWEQIFRIGARSWFEPARVLVTGAGPIGLLAAMIGVHRELEVHVFDTVERGSKPDLVERLGATYHRSVPLDLKPDVIIEATGSPRVAFDMVERVARNGIVCFTGVPSPELLAIDGGRLNREMVLGNVVAFGTVNSNAHHYRGAAEILARVDLAWLEGLITRQVPLERYAEAFAPEPDDVKVVITL